VLGDILPYQHPVAALLLVHSCLPALSHLLDPFGSGHEWDECNSATQNT